MLYYIRDNEGNLEGFTYDNVLYYYMKNVSNDIIGILNSQGEKVATYEYDSWGNILAIKDGSGNSVANNLNHIANINPFRYRSYYYDAETELYYLNSRYYSPMIGRFISVDLGVSNIGLLDGYNLYAYSFNNPINFQDEDGSWPKWVKKVAIGVAVIGVCAAITFATGGSTAPILHYVASQALKYSIGGAVTGLVIGGISGAAKNKSKTKSWKGTGSAIINGAASGFKSGAISGAIYGAVSGSVKAGKAISKWDKGTFDTKSQAIKHHYDRHVIKEHGKAKNFVEYTNDALQFSNRNKAYLKYEFNYKYRNASWNARYTNGGGQFTSSGEIIAFWYKDLGLK